MKLADLLADIKAADSHTVFMNEHPDAFFATGLFILDLKEDKQDIQLDFFMPSEEKLASFQHPSAELKIHDEPIKGLVAQDGVLGVDVGDLKAKVGSVLEDRKVSFSPTKIIAVLKCNEWNLTCMDDMLGIIRVKVNAQSGEEVSFSKGSLLEVAQIKGGDLGQKYDQVKASKRSD